jgi:hypothetical protein
MRTALTILDVKFRDNGTTARHERADLRRYASFHGLMLPSSRLSRTEESSGLVTEFLRLVNEKTG